MSLTFEQITIVTTDPIFIISFISIWFVTIALFFGIGFITFRQGRSRSTPLISFWAYWLEFGVLFFVLPTLVLMFIIFPFWMKLLS